MDNKDRNSEAFNRIIEVMKRLRSECPWDSVQTWDSIRPNTIEEVYELVDAIANRNMSEVKKELGDVLFHVIFYSHIAQEEGKFDIADVCNAVADKLIFRHPKIFGGKDCADNEETWEQMKRREKGGNKTTLSGVPAALPSLIKAYRMQEKALSMGYKQEDAGDVVSDLAAGISSVQSLPESEKSDKMGDLLFRMIKLCKLLKVNPEVALEKRNIQFRSEFEEYEKELKSK